MAIGDIIIYDHIGKKILGHEENSESYPIGLSTEILNPNPPRGEFKDICERLICHADEIQLSLLVYTYDHPPPPVFSKIDMKKIGKQMFPGHNYKGVLK